MAHTFFLLLGGYLVGSLSPAYFLGKLLFNLDIRSEGTGNAGTINTYKVLGLGPAIGTALFDLAKGLIAMHLASQLGASALVMHLTGCAVIVGHVFPFYLGFKGGQGVATATAMMLYYLFLFISRGWLPGDLFLYLGLAVISFAYIASKEELVGLSILPLLAASVIILAPSSEYKIYLLSLILYILTINIINISNFNLFPSPQEEKKQQEINWRLFLRPAAIIFVIHYFHSSRPSSLVLVGSVALFFILLDISRLFSKDVNIFFFKKIKELYKKKEFKAFSSISLFLVAIFLSILFFEKDIAILAVSFLIFGDFFSKFYGVHFGRTKIFDKTLEGSLAHFIACLLTAYLATHFLAFSRPIAFLGALVATIVELLPLKVNDNFSVPLLSAAVMTVFQIF